MAIPLASLSVKLMAPYTNAPLVYTHMHTLLIILSLAFGPLTMCGPIRSAVIESEVTSNIDPPNPSSISAPYGTRLWNMCLRAGYFASVWNWNQMLESNKDACLNLGLLQNYVYSHCSPNDTQSKEIRYLTCNGIV